MGVRMWLNGELIIDRWSSGLNTTSKPVNLVKGKRYNVKVETYVDGTVSTCDLLWKCKEMEYEQNVPFSQLYQQPVAMGSRLMQTDEPEQIQTTISTPSLQQNLPNPVKNSTTISYTLPQQYSSAKMVIATMDGKVIKEIILSGKSNGNIKVDATNLSAGFYTYTMYADGQQIDSKRMAVIK